MIYMKLEDQRQLLLGRRIAERRKLVAECVESFHCRRSLPDRRSAERRVADKTYVALWIETFWAKRLELSS